MPPGAAMLSAKATKPDSAIPVRRVKAADACAALQYEAIEAAEIDRPYPASTAAWLDSLPPSALPEGRFILDKGKVAACLSALFAEKGLADTQDGQWLINDVAALAQTIDRINPSPQLRLRVEAVDDDACRKFHIDAVVARLICTYRGPGTVLTTKPQDADDPPISVATGVPLILKGRRWPGGNGLKLHHRSPAIAGSGTTRFMVVLEGVRAAGDALSAQDTPYPG